MKAQNGFTAILLSPKLAKFLKTKKSEIDTSRITLTIKTNLVFFKSQKNQCYLLPKFYPYCTLRLPFRLYLNASNY